MRKKRISIQNYDSLTEQKHAHKNMKLTKAAKM